VERALAIFDLQPRAQEPAAQLSKGLKQRVALARALLHQPSVVLLDEPTSGLDPESAREVRELILRLREEGRAILVSTHNLDEVERVANRVAVLRGRLVALDAPDALRARLFGARLRITLEGRPEAHAAHLRAAGLNDIRVDASSLSIGVDDPGGAAADIVATLVTAGARIRMVAPEEPPLEEVYLRLLKEQP
jgi:ABC-2 type transport system ATP-binding protein